MALLIKNQSTDPACKTTLIIAPMALLDQWKFEIEMKTNCDMKCLIYHGLYYSTDVYLYWALEFRIIKTQTQPGAAEIRCRAYNLFGMNISSPDQPIIDSLTGYQTMALEWPDFEMEQKKKEKAKRKNRLQGFIVPDSDDESDDLRPRKRGKECECDSSTTSTVWYVVN